MHCITSTPTMATIANLPKLVRAKFKVAQTTGDLTFYQTKVSILRCNGLPVRNMCTYPSKVKTL